MLFSPLQKVHFDAVKGAYSVVTSREHQDGQITLTDGDGEKQIAFDHFGEETIPRTNSKLPMKVWLSVDDIVDSKVMLRYPKSAGTELRIYASEESRFQFNSGDVWFIYESSSGELVVGSMPEQTWRAIGSEDPTDADYQNAVDSLNIPPPQGQTSYLVNGFPRDPAIARVAIETSGYLCAYTGEPTPFLSKRSGFPYLEAHHIIPLGFQSYFDFSLDQVHNIVAMNPLWHRAIHHAIPQTTREIVTSLYNRRASFLTSRNVKVDDLILLYGCEEIL
ncbi:hypothetical protein N9K67_06070 [Opitutaceae bacterium]|nr:hypothetical protein [Opitutaceae bacterium]